MSFGFGVREDGGEVGANPNPKLVTSLSRGKNNNSSPKPNSPPFFFQKMFSDSSPFIIF